MAAPSMAERRAARAQRAATLRQAKLATDVQNRVGAGSNMSMRELNTLGNKVAGNVRGTPEVQALMQANAAFSGRKSKPDAAQMVAMQKMADAANNTAQGQLSNRFSQQASQAPAVRAAQQAQQAAFEQANPQTRANAAMQGPATLQNANPQLGSNPNVSGTTKPMPAPAPVASTWGSTQGPTQSSNTPAPAQPSSFGSGAGMNPPAGFKRGGSVSAPRGAGIAQRGFGKAMKRR